MEKQLWFEKLHFHSDDNNGLVLSMKNMPNQDLYITIEDRNQNRSNTVRLARSGGISTKNFEFLKHAQDMYRALASRVEELIPRVDQMAIDNKQKYYICNIQNNLEIFSEEELKYYIMELYEEHKKIKLDSVFEAFFRVKKYKIVEYSTEE